MQSLEAMSIKTGAPETRSRKGQIGPSDMNVCQSIGSHISVSQPPGAGVFQIDLSQILKSGPKSVVIAVQAARRASLPTDKMHSNKPTQCPPSFHFFVLTSMVCHSGSGSMHGWPMLSGAHGGVSGVHWLLWGKLSAELIPAPWLLPSREIRLHMWARTVRVLLLHGHTSIDWNH